MHRPKRGLFGKWREWGVTLGIWVLAIQSGSILMGSHHSHALDRDVRAVLIGGVYGLGAGTLFGLATYPVHRSTRGIFIGSSVGLVFGLLAGTYYVINRDDPDNPFAKERDFDLNYDQLKWGSTTDHRGLATYVVSRF